MKIVQASIKKVYEIEGKSVLRLLSGGIKLTDAIMKNMGLSAGDKVSYAEDEDDNGRVYIFKNAEGSTVGANKKFANTGLSNILKNIAGVPNLEIKGGNNIIFDMDTEATDAGDGVAYFGLTLKEVILAKETSTEDVTEPATNDESPAIVYDAATEPVTFE